MMKLRLVAALASALVLSLGLVVASENLKSGPQTGETVPGPFHPLNVTGAKAGEKNCLYCQNGANPVAMIFAREMSEPLAMLIKKIDASTGENKDTKMGSFVVFLNDSEALPNQLKEMAEKESIKNVILSVDNPAGPEGYNVSKEADVTVVLYSKHKVKANYAFAKGEMKEKDIDKVVAGISKILPKE